MLIGVRIKRLLYRGDYPDELAMKMLEESGIEIERVGE